MSVREEEEPTDGNCFSLFKSFATMFVGNEERYWCESISSVRIQKIIDATEHVKIEEESEEALKKIEQNLEDVH